MNYPIEVSRSNHHKAALSIVNCFLKLTDFELDLIVGMLNNNIKVLNTKNRKKLRDQLDLNVYTFNNYIKRLKDRKYIIATKDGLGLHPNIIAAAFATEINVTINVS